MSARICFLPAITEPLARSCKRHRAWTLYDPHRVNDPPTHYPHVLFSYEYWSGSMDLGGLRDKGFVFGDSGGFSVMTKGAVLDPSAVLRWQAAVCSVGAILDVPVKGMDRVLTAQSWERGLRYTVANVTRARDLYAQLRGEGTPFRWWGVTHGHFGEQLEMWYKGVTDCYGFADEGEGWAFRPEPVTTDPAAVAALLHFAQQKGIRRAHFLATTAMKTACTLITLGALADLDFISFDSASAAMMAANRTVFMPNADGLAWTLRKERTKSEDVKERDCARRYIWEDCGCPLCNELRARHSKYGDVPVIDWVIYLYLHNLNAQILIFRRYEEEAARGNGAAVLKEVLGAVGYSTVQRSVHTGRSARPADRGAPRNLLDYAAG